MKSADMTKNSQKSFQTHIDRDALKALKMLAVDRDLNVRDVVSDAVREGVRVIREREKLPV